MSQTLYRKYRPQLFAEMIGQNHIKTTLQQEIATGQIAQAYLFCGPRGLGKTTAARLLAKALNCPKRQAGASEPCNDCPSCQAISDGSALDLIEVDAASQTQVDKVRENIIANVRVAPVSSKYKVFIIDEVHMLSASSFNALLKTLEEPPAHAIFILCTTETHKIPETIISRCQRFDFKRVARGELLELLVKICQNEKREVAKEVLNQVAAQSEGFVRDAESLLGQLLTLPGKIDQEAATIILPRSDFGLAVQLLQLLAARQTAEAILLVNKLAEEGVALPNFNQNLVELLRYVLLLKNGERAAALVGDYEQDVMAALKKLAADLPLAEIVRWLEIFIALKNELKFSQIPQLPFEMAIVRICEKLDDNDQLPPAGGSGRGEKTIVSPVKAATDDLASKKTKPAAAVKEIKPEVKSVEPVAERKTHAASSGNLDLALIKEKWPDLLQEVLNLNYPLAALLRMSQPLRIIGSTLEIGLKYAFYADRLNDRKSQGILDKAANQVFGCPLKMCGIVKEDIEPLEVGEEAPAVVAPVKQEFNAAQVLEMMGGEVVE